MSAPQPQPLMTTTPFRLQVVVLDDNPADLELVTRLLDELPQPLKVCTVTRPNELVQRLESGQPADIVMVDNLLGAESGVELIEKWLPAYPDIAFVLMTGMGGEAVATDALRAGAMDYVAKETLSVPELNRCLSHVLERRKDRQRLGAVMNTAFEAIFILDQQTLIVAANPAAARLFKYSHNDLLNTSISQLLPITPEGYPYQSWAESLATTPSILLNKTHELYGHRGNGTLFPLEVSLAENSIGEQCFFICVIRDLSERKSLEVVRDRQAMIIQTAGEFIGSASPDGTILDINPAGRRLMELPEQGAIPIRHIRDCHPETEQQRFAEEILPHLFEQGFWRGESLLLTYQSRELIPVYLVANAQKDAHGKVLSLAAIVHDLRAEKAAAQHLKGLAETDPLTGLANRALFTAQLKQLLAGAKRRGSQIALMFIDLDRFKEINDTLGHKAGDELLQAVAKRLQENTREADLVARLGGDEFVVLIEDPVNAHGLDTLAVKLLNALGQSYELQGENIQSTPSIGIATYPDCAQDADGLLKCADTAMYQAKRNGRNECQFYSREMHASINRHTLLKRVLAHSLEKKALRIHYQPIFNQQQQLVGAEALLRMPLDDVAPEELIPLAEKTGLINTLGDWVLKKVIKEISDWRQIHAYQGFVSVNTSLMQFRKKHFGVRLAGWLQMHGLPKDSIVLELSEANSLGNVDSCMRTFQDISDFQVPIAIDDFGTGYASFKHLEKLPLAYFKIDQSFIQRLENDQKQVSKLISAMIAMAESMQLKIVAEGIETDIQANWFKSYPQVLLQGFYYGAPSDDFENLYLKQKNNKLV